VWATDIEDRSDKDNLRYYYKLGVFARSKEILFFEVESKNLRPNKGKIFEDLVKSYDGNLRCV
jgi:hypothetical protein